MNVNEDTGLYVLHLHMHLLGGENLSTMVGKKKLDYELIKTFSSIAEL